VKMKDFGSRKPNVTDPDLAVRPGDFPVGSNASRAAARIKLEQWSGDPAPNLSLVFYESGERHEDGTLGAPVRTDAKIAIIEGGKKPAIHVDRLASESLDEFHLRVGKIMSESRGRGKPRAAFFLETLPTAR
jgi:hypothetical protein